VEVGDGEGVKVAVGGIGVGVNVAVGTGVRVGGGSEGTHATSKIKRIRQNPERSMRVSLGD
jgi:hypothetical protein